MNIGDTVQVDFLDHCENHDEPVMCRVYGLLTAKADTHITIETWTLLDPDQAEKFDDTSCFVILTSTIYYHEVLCSNSSS